MAAFQTLTLLFVTLFAITRGVVDHEERSLCIESRSELLLDCQATDVPGLIHVQKVVYGYTAGDCSIPASLSYNDSCHVVATEWPGMLVCELQEECAISAVAPRLESCGQAGATANFLYVEYKCLQGGPERVSCTLGAACNAHEDWNLETGWDTEGSNMDHSEEEDSIEDDYVSDHDGTSIEDDYPEWSSPVDGSSEEGSPEYEDPEWGDPEGDPEWGDPEADPEWGDPEADPEWGDPEGDPEWGDPEGDPEWGGPESDPEWGGPEGGPGGASTDDDGMDDSIVYMDWEDWGSAWEEGSSDPNWSSEDYYSSDDWWNDWWDQYYSTYDFQDYESPDDWHNYWDYYSSPALDIPGDSQAEPRPWDHGGHSGSGSSSGGQQSSSEETSGSSGSRPHWGGHHRRRRAPNSVPLLLTRLNSLLSTDGHYITRDSSQTNGRHLDARGRQGVHITTGLDSKSRRKRSDHETVSEYLAQPPFLAYMVSPNYPYNYLNNLDGTCFLQTLPGSTLHLQFERFHMEDHSTCEWDFLTVRTNQYAVHLCSTIEPGSRRDIGSDWAWLKFYTDDSVTDMGFLIAAWAENHNGHMSKLGIWCGPSDYMESYLATIDPLQRVRDYVPEHPQSGASEGMDGDETGGSNFVVIIAAAVGGVVVVVIVVAGALCYRARNKPAPSNRMAQATKPSLDNPDSYCGLSGGRPVSTGNPYESLGIPPPPSYAPPAYQPPARSSPKAKSKPKDKTSPKANGGPKVSTGVTTRTDPTAPPHPDDAIYDEIMNYSSGASQPGSSDAVYLTPEQAASGSGLPASYDNQAYHAEFIRGRIPESPPDYTTILDEPQYMGYEAPQQRY